MSKVTPGSIYDNIVSQLYTDGNIVSPRGKKTYELLNYTFALPTTSFVPRVKMNKRLAVLEGLMLVTGTFELTSIKSVAPNANLNLYWYQSDYGPRTAKQIPRVVELLKEDEDTRRAVVYFNSGSTPSEDLACTTSMQFLVRNDTLQTIVTMRSWDVVFGLPNDVIMFSMLSQAVARCIGKMPGVTFVNASSLHMYEETAHLAKSADNEQTYNIDIDCWGVNSEQWSDYSSAAMLLIDLLVKSRSLSNIVNITT